MTDLQTKTKCNQAAIRTPPVVVGLHDGDKFTRLLGTQRDLCASNDDRARTAADLTDG